MHQTAFQLVTLATLALSTLFAQAAYATCNEINASEGGFYVWRSENHCHWFQLSGLLQVNEVLVSGRDDLADKGFPSGANIQRAELVAEGGIGSYWNYEMTLSFEEGTRVASTKPKLDAMLSYEGFENTKINIGQRQPYYFMAMQVEPEDNIAMEQPLAVDFLHYNSRLVLSLEHYREGLTVALALGVVSNGAQAGQDDDLTGAGAAAQSDLPGIQGRVTFAPWHKAGRVFQVGVSGMYEKKHAKSDSGALYGHAGVSGRKGHWLTSDELLTTSDIYSPGVENITIMGTELLGLWGPVSFQAEYIEDRFKRLAATAPADRPKYSGGYVTVGYMLTGETREYNADQGVLGGVTPATTCGAWEIYGQYSAGSFRYRDVGPVAQIAVGGINWYATNHIRLTAEYLNFNLGRLNTAMTTVIGPAKRKMNILGLRAQAAWM